MMEDSRGRFLRRVWTLRQVWLALTCGFAVLPLSGCLMVGYSSRGGWFLWPGSLGILLLVLLVLFVVRRR